MVPHTYGIIKIEHKSILWISRPFHFIAARASFAFLFLISLATTSRYSRRIHIMCSCLSSRKSR